jgi:4-amino-4-deoxy-L-arabinose transferase-like glycosyltransferase
MRHLPILFLLGITLVRFWLTLALPIAPSEAYVWLCAHHLDWGFFDGPAGTAALVHGTTGVLGEGAAGLRIAFPFLAAVATIGVYLLGAGLFGRIAGIWAAVALNVLPAFNLASIEANPQLPALTFSVLAAVAFFRALDGGGLVWWLAGGLANAVAGQFQVTAICLAAGPLIACACLRRHRGEWARPGLYLAFIIALGGLAPILMWNQTHGWPALALGTLHTAMTPRWSEIPSALWGSLMAISIPLAIAWLAGAVVLFRASRAHLRPRLLFAMAAPVLLCWVYAILHGQVESTLLLIAIALTAGGIVHAFLGTGLLRRLGAVALVLAASSSAYRAFSTDPTWRDASAVLGAVLAKAQPGHPQPLFLIAPDPDATSALAYYLAGSRTEVFLRESQDASNQFSLWPRYDDFVESAQPAQVDYQLEGNTTNPYLGRSALYVTPENPDDLPQTITAAFEKHQLFGTLTFPGGRTLHLYLCENYQTMPL